MNKLTIIGNLTRDPELRTTQSSVYVCSFTVAVNRRHQKDGQEPEADFFQVAAWRQLGENCAQFLAKGRKVAVTGPVSVRTYTAQDGTTRATMNVNADEVEFLTPKGEGGQAPAPAPAQTPAINTGYIMIDSDDLPF